MCIHIHKYMYNIYNIYIYLYQVWTNQYSFRKLSLNTMTKTPRFYEEFVATWLPTAFCWEYIDSHK